MDKTCLFCDAADPTSREHIIPESLGNDDLILEKEVCNLCNNYFAKIENFVLQKTDFAFWRAFLGIKTRKGKLPSIDLSQPKKNRGIYPAIHPKHDNISLVAHDDGSCSIDIDDDLMIQDIVTGRKTQFRFVLTPHVLHQFGRLLCKIGIELICSVDPEEARDRHFQAARHYARHGSMLEIWPIFHYSSGSIQDLRWSKDCDTEEIQCYDYSLFEFKGKYVLFCFKIGTNNWIVCLNDMWPTPEIRSAFPQSELQLIWYHKESYR